VVQSRSGYPTVLKRHGCTLGQKQRGSQFDYIDSDHLTNRGAEGFVLFLFRMTKTNLPVPDHSTLSKRGKS
jgi:hypothetical protein